MKNVLIDIKTGEEIPIQGVLETTDEDNGFILAMTTENIEKLRKITCLERKVFRLISILDDPIFDQPIDAFVYIKKTYLSTFSEDSLDETWPWLAFPICVNRLTNLDVLHKIS